MSSSTKLWTCGFASYGEPIIYNYSGEWCHIGNYVSIARSVEFMIGGEHRTDRVTTFPFECKINKFKHSLWENPHPYKDSDTDSGDDSNNNSDGKKDDESKLETSSKKTKTSIPTKVKQWCSIIRNSGTIKVGSDVWIGSSALIMKGVTIGHGAVIGARALVTRDVPPFAIVGGHPAKIIRYRFDAHTIKWLLESEWWNWSLQKVTHMISRFMQSPHKKKWDELADEYDKSFENSLRVQVGYGNRDVGLRDVSYCVLPFTNVRIPADDAERVAFFGVDPHPTLLKDVMVDTYQGGRAIYPIGTAILIFADGRHRSEVMKLTLGLEQPRNETNDQDESDSSNDSDGNEDETGEGSEEDYFDEEQEKKIGKQSLKKLNRELVADVDAALEEYKKSYTRSCSINSCGIAIMCR